MSILTLRCVRLNRLVLTATIELIDATLKAIADHMIRSRLRLMLTGGYEQERWKKRKDSYNTK